MLCNVLCVVCVVSRHAAQAPLFLFLRGAGQWMDATLVQVANNSCQSNQPHRPTCLYKYVHVHVLIPYRPWNLVARLRAALASGFAAICLQAVICMSNSSSLDTYEYKCALGGDWCLLQTTTSTSTSTRLLVGCRRPLRVHVFAMMIPSDAKLHASFSAWSTSRGRSLAARIEQRISGQTAAWV